MDILQILSDKHTESNSVDRGEGLTESEVTIVNAMILRGEAHYDSDEGAIRSGRHPANVQMGEQMYCLAYDANHARRGWPHE